MAFNSNLPTWNATGIEPPQSLKDAGWQASQKPPAEYFNWFQYTAFNALQEIQQKAGEVKTVNGNAPDANGNVVVETATTWADIQDKPTTFTPSEHTHPISDVTNLQTTLNNKASAQSVSDLSDEVATHKADYVKHPGFGTASGTANTYTVTLDPAPTSYIEGMGVVVAINADATGASTLNVNGLGVVPLKKANGNDATNLKQNGVYTFRYHDDGTNQSFILQGEGGEGTAQPSQVLRNETFTNDEGLQTGILTDKSGVENWGDAQSFTGDGTGYLQVMMPSEPAYVDGTTGFKKYSPGYTPNNIRDGVSIFGVTGTLVEGKKADSGSAMVNTSLGSFNTGVDSAGYIEVTKNLGFTPRLVIVKRNDYDENAVRTVYINMGGFYFRAIKHLGPQEVAYDISQFSISSTYMKIPVDYDSNATWQWYASE